ncbi:transcriptional regulator [Spirochaetia bacterium]|nr:transcriptional regulator [Spirochaetia bacterium]
MPGFSDRLRTEIEYAGLNQKEFAARAGIKKRALDGYLGVQKSMPPADVAIKMALALGLSVEYLVSGREVKDSFDIARYVQFRDVLDDLAVLPDEMVNPIRMMIQSAADQKRREKQR